MADLASHAAKDFIERTRDAAEDVAPRAPWHTLPTALIGIGCAWLLYAWLRDGDRGSASSPSYDDVPPGMDDVPPGMYDPEEFYRESDTWDRSAGSRGSRRSGGTTDPGGEVGGGVTRTQGQLPRLMRDHPFIVAAGAMAAGAALGLALPATELENEWIGAARESVMEWGKDVSRAAASHVRDMAGDLAGDLVNRVVSG